MDLVNSFMSYGIRVRVEVLVSLPWTCLYDKAVTLWTPGDDRLEPRVLEHSRR